MLWQFSRISKKILHKSLKFIVASVLKGFMGSGCESHLPVCLVPRELVLVSVASQPLWFLEKETLAPTHGRRMARLVTRVLGTGSSRG